MLAFPDWKREPPDAGMLQEEFVETISAPDWKQELPDILISFTLPLDATTQGQPGHSTTVEHSVDIVAKEQWHQSKDPSIWNPINHGPRMEPPTSSHMIAQHPLQGPGSGSCN